jgi:hypothetical protein
VAAGASEFSGGMGESRGRKMNKGVCWSVVCVNIRVNIHMQFPFFFFIINGQDLIYVLPLWR